MDAVSVDVDNDFDLTNRATYPIFYLKLKPFVPRINMYITDNKILIAL